jgi:hypothetical protein
MKYIKVTVLTILAALSMQFVAQAPLAAAAPATFAAKAAQNNDLCDDAEHCNLIKKYVNPLITTLAALVGLSVVVGIVWGGIQYSAAGGDPQKVASAKDKIRRALTALVTFIFFYALLQWLIPGGVL